MHSSLLQEMTLTFRGSILHIRTNNCETSSVNKSLTCKSGHPCNGCLILNDSMFHCLQGTIHFTICHRRRLGEIEIMGQNAVVISRHFQRLQVQVSQRRGWSSFPINTPAVCAPCDSITGASCVTGKNSSCLRHIPKEKSETKI